ncbi:hypothetical protein TJA_18390 [Thermus sp. LT1-2-5]
MTDMKRLSLLAGMAAVGLLAKAQMADVPRGHWAEAAVRALLEKGILTGYQDGTFRGQQALSRYQAAVMLYRAYLTWTEEVLAQVRKTLEDAGLAPERVAEALSGLAALQEALPQVERALAEQGVRLEALGADLEELRAALVSLLEAQGEAKAQADKVKALEEALARADGAYREQASRLAALEARLAALERAVEELARSLKEAEEARLKEAQATGRRVYALEERAKALEEATRSRAQGEVFLGVGEGGPLAGLSLRYGEAHLRLGTDGAEAALRAGPLELRYRDALGREALARYGLFSGIRFLGEVGVGDGGYLFGAAYVEHERQGGLLPGVYARLGAGAGLVGGEPGRYWLEAQGGALLGPVDLTLGFGRYFGLGEGDTPLSALFLSATYPGAGFALSLRGAYAVPHEDIGRESAYFVAGGVEASLAPFRLTLTGGYRDGLRGFGVASYAERFRFTTATGFFGGVRVGYEVRF